MTRHEPAEPRSENQGEEGRPHVSDYPCGVTSSPARLLIVAYAALTALLQLYVLVAHLMILFSNPVRAFVWSSHGPSVSTG